VTNVEEVVKVGEKVWVKVVEVEDGGGAGGARVSLSMKHVDQGTGKDRDYDGFEYAKEVRAVACCVVVLDVVGCGGVWCGVDWGVVGWVLPRRVQVRGGFMAFGGGAA
jgi:hypothetical protein